MLSALVLAGSLNRGRLQECSREPYEAMISIGGRSMVSYVVQALLNCARVGRVLVVGPEIADLPDGVEVVAPAGDLLDNVERGVRALGDAGQVLLATCDIPLLSGRAVENFLCLCRQRQADIYYPVIERQLIESRYAGAERTYVHFKEGDYTGGNLILFDPAILPRCLERGRQLVAARKSPLRLAGLVGWGFLLRFLLRRITLAEAERKVSQLLGVEGAVVLCSDPEVGVDVDKPSDLLLVRRVLSPGPVS
ncbi:nucleotidyltransferase family protein [Desulfurispora thermophila]|uniref:nucleotidyltransferase family protein n=1 Tax=Desulfurispora thermophila TaxID=265470 RepID=UPI0003709A80|nr:nucleotidyltransferase family protein [Desulfurispora thermophila]